MGETSNYTKYLDKNESGIFKTKNSKDPIHTNEIVFSTVDYDFFLSSFLCSEKKIVPSVTRSSKNWRPNRIMTEQRLTQTHI